MIQLVRKQALVIAMAFALILFVAVAPQIVGAQEIVPDCGAGEICGFCDLVTLGENIVQFLTLILAPLLAVIMIVYAGFLYLTAGPNPGQVARAKTVLIKAILGLILVLVAWLIIDLVITSFLSPDTLRDLGGSWGDLPGC